MDLKGKSALITGSSRGIGREVALRFARDGAKVVVNGVASRDKAEAVAREIRALGGEAAVVLADVSKRADAERLVKRSMRPSASSTFSSATPASSSTVPSPRVPRRTGRARSRSTSGASSTWRGRRCRT
jgi:NAD(P)-dependent dehydrogenase (short-subunit alcohol dehydrogenase family)